MTLSALHRIKPLWLAWICCTTLLSACASSSAAVVSTLVLAPPAVSSATPAPALVKSPTRLRATKTATHPAPTATPSATRVSLASATPSEALPTATAAATQVPVWQDLPIVPAILSSAMRDVYIRGLEDGNNPRVFAKVGDCSTWTKSFLGAFDLTTPLWYRLGPYTDLTGVIKQYNGSFSRVSVASFSGYSTSSVLSVINSDPKQCKSDESPIQCEYSKLKPSLVLINIGTNDYLDKPGAFERNMRIIIEFWLEKGVVPIVATKADNLEGDDSINATIIRLANEYELPLWNFRRAVQDLPNQGLRLDDPGHLVWGHDFFDDPTELQNGGQVRNLTGLQVLDFVWRSLSNP